MLEVARKFPEVSDQSLDDLASRIARIGVSVTRVFVIEVGRLVTGELYGGDASAWRLNGPRDKDCSLRRLASRPSLGISPATLYRALSAYELLLKAGSTARWPALSISHLRMVDGLSFGDQSALLDRAERERWPVARLDREAGGLRPSRPPAPSVLGTESPEARRWLRSILRLRTSVSLMNRELAEVDRALVVRALAELEAWSATVRDGLSSAGPDAVARQARPG